MAGELDARTGGDCFARFGRHRLARTLHRPRGAFGGWRRGTGPMTMHTADRLQVRAAPIQWKG